MTKQEPTMKMKGEEECSFFTRVMVFIVPTTLIVSLWLFLNAKMGKQHNLNTSQRVDLYPLSSSPFQERIIFNASDFFTWNTYLGQCEPNVCNGARFDTILPLLSLPIALLEDLHGRWYDAERIRQCFQHKYIVLMGDSTVQETIFDLYHLLAGLHRKHDYNIPDG